MHSCFLYEQYPSFAEINIRSLHGAEQNDGKLLIRSSRDFILHSAYPRTAPQSSGMGWILPEAPHQFSLTLINNLTLRHQIAEQPLTVSNSEMDVACQGWRGDSKWFLIGCACQSREEREDLGIDFSPLTHIIYEWLQANSLISHTSRYLGHSTFHTLSEHSKGLYWYRKSTHLRVFCHLTVLCRWFWYFEKMTKQINPTCA